MDVLSVDSCPLVGEFLALDLDGYGITAKAVSSIRAAKVQMVKSPPDVVVTELFLKGDDFRDLACHRWLFPVILLTTCQSALNDPKIKTSVDS